MTCLRHAMWRSATASSFTYIERDPSWRVPMSSSRKPQYAPHSLNRRRFVEGLALGAGLVAIGPTAAYSTGETSGPPMLRGDRFDLLVGPTPVNITGATDTFLMNGKAPAANWTGLFDPGQRVRLRFINGSSMSTFDVRIPGLDMTVVQADGSDVDPVAVEEFRIGVAETYDVIVRPRQAAYTIFAQAEDRSGYARGTLATREGLAAAVPPMDPRPMRTMTDMGMGGMAHGGMDMNKMSDMQKQGPPATPSSSAPMSGMDHSKMPGMSHDMSGMDHSKMPGMSQQGSKMPGMSGDMKGMDHSKMGGAAAQGGSIPTSNADGVDVSSLSGKPSVDNVAMETKNRLAEAGDGLDGNGRRNLTYADLRSIRPNTQGGPPTRAIEFHLTGNMQRWIWGFNGKKFSEAGPIAVKLDERIRFVLINDTMMEHPIHLHGFLFEVENNQGNRLPLKHTINVKPGERMSFVFTADVAGHWAFHCHLLYHMEMGMFRTILVS